MKPSLIFRRLRCYLADRILAHAWLVRARYHMSTGCRAKALNALKRYREAKRLMTDSWQRLQRTHQQINLGTLPAFTL